MAVEIAEEYGGSGSSFMSSTLTVEEIAKIDPSVSVLVDLQNTLGNNLMIKVANKEQKDKYLPRLAQNTVSIHNMYKAHIILNVIIHIHIYIYDQIYQKKITICI